MTPLHYDYSASKEFCQDIGLVWLGDSFVKAADTEAYELGFTQTQVDSAMRHHLWQVNWLFTPSNYNWKQRIGLALRFLFGLGVK